MPIKPNLNPEKYRKTFAKVFYVNSDNIEDKLITELTKVFSDMSRKYNNNQTYECDYSRTFKFKFIIYFIETKIHIK